MKKNQLIEQHDEQSFLDAIRELESNNIVFEGQFPFLNDATMRDSNSHKIEEALKQFGFNEKIICLSWNIDEQGFMHCMFFLGQKFETLEQVKATHLKYFKQKTTLSLR